MLRAQAESILNGYSLQALLDVVIAVVGVVAVFFHHDGKAHGVHLRVFAAGQRLNDDVLRAVHDDLGSLGGSHTLEA